MEGKRTWKRIKTAVLVSMLLTLAVISPKDPYPHLKAWWGTLYPKYCFSAPEEGDWKDAQIRIKFRWLHGL